MKTDIDIHNDLYNNIVMSGGTTMFAGVASHVRQEIETVAPPSIKIKVIAPTAASKSLCI